MIKITTQTLQKAVAEHAHDSSRAVCPHCGSSNVYGISRVVGYFSRIDNWNASKRAELKDRQKGKYKI